MKLKEWIKKNSLSCSGAAEKFNIININPATNVWRYCNGQRIPHPIIMKKFIMLLINRLHLKIFMSNTGKKTTFNHKLVKITWWDIKSSEKSWIAEDEIMKEDIAICYDVGWIWKETKDKLWLFTSYSFDEFGMDVGGVTTFPMGVIKK
jgi:hypothetical protein